MKTKRTHQITISIIIWFALFLLACNLGTSSAPPTLAPLPTNTPLATLGYSAVGPTGVPGIGSTPVPSSDVEIFKIVDQVETDRLMYHVTTLQNFFTRHVNSDQISSTQGIGAARSYIEDQFEAYLQSSGGNLYTFKMEFEVTFDEQTTKQANVVAVIQGTEPGAGTIVIGSHYDSVGTPLDSATAYAPGATDNAAGDAAILEIARIMSQRQYKSSIMFVLFSGEEVGRQGSRAFAKWLRDNNIDVIAMLNVDGLGNVQDFHGAVNDKEMRIFSAGPNETSSSRRLARMINFIGFNYGLDLDLTVLDAIDREARYGDHFSFSEAGYPAIRIMEANEEKLNADPSDTVDFIEPAYFRQNVQAILAVLTALADGPRPPRNITLRDKGNGIGQLVWEPVPDAVSYVVALRRPGALIYEQQFEVTDTMIEWDKFSRYGGIAIAAKQANGLVGPLSKEIVP